MERSNLGLDGEGNWTPVKELSNMMMNERCIAFFALLASIFIHVHPSTIILHLASEVSILAMAFEVFFLVVRFL